ncbi:ArnT family glycosyltransferase [Haloplanus halophilus]|uniref:ArnT family glycosyltransferase n=1 Tax=Haloplanus halophilus TaxID=2949993 RepID=UPI00203FF5DB|nr:glycosyltransferase family 39 protein [Haloplanus sp. GDY1]
MRRRTYTLAAAAVALAGAAAVWIVSTQVFPYHSLNHDEGVYLQQAAMLLEGQLNLRPPLEGAFRPWFFVENGDRLYPKYTPVPAAMFALGRLVGGYRLALVGIAAANLALVVAVVDEVFDRPTGLVAGGFVLASPLFLVDSSVFLPYAPTTLLNLGFAYGYLRADRTGDRRWAAVAGTAVGLAFFARPYTAVLFAAPFVCHALWSLYRDWQGALERQAIVAALGLAGVGTTLGYNALVTGSAWLFPYEAFAPRDGLGFGHREILAHEIHYTPELAMRANGKVVELFFTEWIAGGALGAALAVLGIARTVHRRPSAREGVIGGLFVSIVAGNVYFWGNFNILGDIDRAGDGLVSAFGPYYHFDLLLPTAAFAAAGILWGGRLLHRALDERVDRRLARTAFVLVLVVSAGAVGSVTANDLDERIAENMEATDTYEDVYEPFEAGPPRNSLVLLPDPYGDWLNHPFQPLRNDPGFDGRTVYAIDDEPFAVVDEFPDRRAYRYVYRGGWAPYAGSPEDARLQRVRDVSGGSVRLDTAVGIPDGAIGVTARIATDEGSVYYVAPNVTDSLAVNLSIEDGRIHVAGDVRPVENETVAVDGRDDVRLTVFVDYGPGGGFAYRLDLPVEAADGTVRALTPRIERCRNARACGGAAAYIPSSAPDGVFVRSELVAGEPNP